MAITLALSPEQKAQLEQLAAAAGTDLTSFILNVVQEQLEVQNGPSVAVLPYEEWSRDFRSWVASHRSRNPHFEDYRDSIYD
jgi:hypothetical protein